MTGTPTVVLPPPLAEQLARHHGTGYRDRLCARLERVREALAGPVTTVVFGGHLGAGKSSLLNLLTCRRLLPVGDFPETGVACVIRGGPADRVTVPRPDGLRDILPCTPAAIAGAVSLIAADGPYRGEVLGGPGRVDIELADSAVPPGVRWIDSPGIDGTGVTARRAAAAARQADLLVWVTDSRQPLSMTEEDFLREHLRRQGPASLAVLVNVFLTEDTPELWDRFLGTRAEWHRRRLAAALDGARPAGLAFVGVRAATADPTGFGGPEARALLARLTGPRDGGAAAARRARAASLLRPHAEEAAFRIREQRSVLAQERARTALAEAELAARSEMFRAHAERVVDHALRQWTVRARECGDRVAALLAAGRPVLRDGTYGNLLTDLLRRAAASLAHELATSVSAHAQRTGHAVFTAGAVERLVSLTRPEQAVVEVADRLGGRLSYGREAPPDGTPGGRFAARVPAVARAFDTATASVARAGSAADAAVPDRARTRAVVLAAAAMAGEDVVRWRRRILELVHGVCRPLAPVPVAPDTGPLTVLEALHRHLARCLESCGATAAHDRVTGDAPP
ncbi:dynamin family protein [Streptomyces olivoreticuli]|uniref:dynamin family protein n=1 Tax=Streptomyces olivoreticuli TaxID=68246 RepID=UPI0013C33CD0|nr:dynamin family protein [Streptomyces olivoreticuli]